VGFERQFRNSLGPARASLLSEVCAVRGAAAGRPSWLLRTGFYAIATQTRRRLAVAAECGRDRADPDGSRRGPRGAAGANPNGRDEDGVPLWAACTFGYTLAVDALVRCGARIDNLVLAAAAGDLAAVRAHFDEGGKLIPIASWGRARIPGGKLDVRHVLEYALIQAALHGRRAVVELLLTKAPDLTVGEPNWNNTALSAARRAKRTDIVALLEPLTP
jgi:hypothetical protein